MNYHSEKFGEDGLLLSWITLAAAFQPSLLNAETPAPISITSDNVELDGAGSFDFEPDPSAFTVDPPLGGDGLSFKVRLWLDSAGKPISCDIGETPLPVATRTGCAQLMRSAQFRLTQGMTAPLRRGFVDVRLSFFKDAPRGPDRQIFANPYPAYNNVALAYPPDETRPADRLRQADGSIIMTIDPDDYPPIAIRYGLESQSAVLLGISRDGAIKSCRPVSSAGLRTAFLDNYTCALFLQRGHFQFTSDAPSYEGLRYLAKIMRWKMPGR